MIADGDFPGVQSGVVKLTPAQSATVLLAWLLGACATTTPREHFDEWIRSDVCRPGAVCPAYQLQDPCPNWNDSLKIALEKAACNHGRGDPASRCQKRLAMCAKACDICPLLQPGQGPLAYEWELSRDPTRGRRGLTCPPFDMNCPGWGNWSSEWKALLDDDICRNSKYVVLLADTMIHEAIHSCGSMTGRKPPMDFEPSECNPYDITEECMK